MSFDVRLWDQGGGFNVILQPYGQPAQDWKTEEARWNSGAFGYAWPGGTVTAVAGGMRINWADSGFVEAPTSNPILGMNFRTRAGYTYTVTIVGDGTGTGADVRVDFPYVAVSAWQAPSSTTPMVVSFDETVDGSSYVGVAAQGPANGFSPGTNFTVASFTIVETVTPSGPGRLSGGTLVDEVTNGANVVLVMPPTHSLDGTVVIHSGRNSNTTPVASISDSSGATWTVRDGPTVANSASRHYVWSAPWTAAMEGATVTVAWSGGGQNSAGSAEVWEGYDWDAITVAVTGGDTTPPFNETAPAHTAGGTDWAALAFGGGRGVNDDSQPTLDIATVPSGWSNLQEAHSTQATGTARNQWAWSASKVVTGSASISAEVFTDTLATNSRYAATVSLLLSASGVAGAPNVRASGAWNKTIKAKAKVTGTMTDTLIKAKVAGTMTDI